MNNEKEIIKTRPKSLHVSITPGPGPGSPGTGHSSSRSLQVQVTPGPCHSGAGSLNHSDATADASSEPILKVAHLIAIFKSKWQWQARKHFGNTHQLTSKCYVNCHVLNNIPYRCLGRCQRNIKGTILRKLK